MPRLVDDKSKRKTRNSSHPDRMHLDHDDHQPFGKVAVKVDRFLDRCFSHFCHLIDAHLTFREPASFY